MLLGSSAIGAYAYELREDPYQNAWDDTKIKIYYLRRIANAPGVYPGGDPEFKFEMDERYLRYLDYGLRQEVPGGPFYNLGGPTRAARSFGRRALRLGQYYYTPNTSTHPKGEVYVTPDAAQLETLFKTVAKDIIKKRLIK